jgi:hypothetical protein
MVDRTTMGELPIGDPLAPTPPPDGVLTLKFLTTPYRKRKTKLQPPASLAEEANREHLISRVHYAVVYLHLPFRPPELTNPAEIWRPPNNAHHTQTWHQHKHKA